MEQRPGRQEPPTTVLASDEEPVPYVGNEYVCPQCRAVIPTRKITLMAKPPRFAHLLADVIRCCYCNFLFSYRPNAGAPRTMTNERGRAIGTVVSG